MILIFINWIVTRCCSHCQRITMRLNSICAKTRLLVKLSDVLVLSTAQYIQKTSYQVCWLSGLAYIPTCNKRECLKIRLHCQHIKCKVVAYVLSRVVVEYLNMKDLIPVGNVRIPQIIQNVTMHWFPEERTLKKHRRKRLHTSRYCRVSARHRMVSN